MELYEAIQKRCSVRQYVDKPVEPDKLRRVLDAGRISPTGRNLQLRTFVVVQKAANRAALGKASGQEWIAQAPVLIAVVSSDPVRVMHCGVPAGPVDCAIAIDHMTLAAVAEDLGTCWIGHFEQDACRKALGIPEGMQIIELLTLGYPAKPVTTAKDRKPFEEVVRLETFTGRP